MSISDIKWQRKTLKVLVLLRPHILVRRYNHERKGEKDDADREEERGTIIHASDLSEPEPPWHPTLERGSHPIR